MSVVKDKENQKVTFQALSAYFWFGEGTFLTLNSPKQAFLVTRNFTQITLK